MMEIIRRKITNRITESNKATHLDDFDSDDEGKVDKVENVVACEGLGICSVYIPKYAILCDRLDWITLLLCEEREVIVIDFRKGNQGERRQFLLFQVSSLLELIHARRCSRFVVMRETCKRTSLLIYLSGTLVTTIPSHMNF